MNLNDSIRSAFVRNVLADVPQEDFDEQMRSLVMKDAKSRVPPALLKKENAEWLNHAEVTFHYSGEWDQENRRTYYGNRFTAVVPCISRGEHKLSEEAQKELDRLMLARVEQKQKVDNLRTKLIATASAFRTVKQLREALPEFEKYLPKPEDKTGNLPAISQVKEELIAAGWPKDKQPEAVAA